MRGFFLGSKDSKSSFVICVTECSTLLEKLGSNIITEHTDERLVRAFKSLGGTFQDFLTTLDGVHDVVQGQDTNSEDDQVIRAKILNIF